MAFAVAEISPNGDFVFLALAAASAASASFLVFLGCFYWFRREQRRLQRRILGTISRAVGEPGELFVTGRDAAACGELVAQFKVNRGRQVLSVLEADGRRFIHVEGELSSRERDRMVRYLKSEGFMS
jgi:hypothetical protein